MPIRPNYWRVLRAKGQIGDGATRTTPILARNRLKSIVLLVHRKPEIETHTKINAFTLALNAQERGTSLPDGRSQGSATYFR